MYVMYFSCFYHTLQKAGLSGDFGEFTYNVITAAWMIYNMSVIIICVVAGSQNACHQSPKGPGDNTMTAFPEEIFSKLLVMSFHSGFDDWPKTKCYTFTLHFRGIFGPHLSKCSISATP